MRQSRHFLFCVLFPANCDAGHYFNKTMGECRPCGIGFYQNLTGQDFCHECPMGQATRMDNSTTCNDCYCEYHVSLPITQRCAKQTTLHSLGSCTENIPDSKVLRANMGPTWAGRIQVVPMLAHELCYLGSQWYRFHPFYLTVYSTSSVTWMTESVFILLHLSKACWEIWLSDEQPHFGYNGQWQRALCLVAVLQDSLPNPQRNWKLENVCHKRN